MLHEDVALSSVFIVKSKLALAVIYGCSEGQKGDIIRRLDTVDLTYNHPVLPSGLITELERTRLVGRVDDLLDGFALKASSDQELDIGMDKSQMTTFLKMCFESRVLIHQIRAEKKQLNIMASRICKSEYPRASTSQSNRFSANMKFRRHFARAGRQITARLSEICSEYEDKLNECDMVIENMSLTMQTAS